MNITLRQIRAFVLVGRLGSFTRAAQAMHITQSALSLLVRELESAMDTRLVDRPTRAISLPAAGSEFYTSAQRVLADLEHAIDNIDQLVSKQRGRVVIAAPLMLSSTFLPRILAGFKALYPGIRLVLHDCLPTQVLPQVSAGTADLGIGSFRHAEKDLERVLLFKEAMVAVFPASHPFASVGRLTWRQLARGPVLALRQGSIFRDLTETGFRSAGLTLEPQFEADYAGSLIGLVDASWGVAVLPSYATTLTDKARIRWKRLEDPIVEREVLMVHRAGVSLSPAARAFADFLINQKPQPPAGKRRSAKVSAGAAAPAHEPGQ
jgi:DNA-binding transcriptional LysR family regulator